MIESPSPNFNKPKSVSTDRGEVSSEIVANVEHNTLGGSNVILNRQLETNYVFENESNKIINNKDDVNMYVECEETSSNASTDRSNNIVKRSGAITASTSDNKLDETKSIGSNSCKALELNIQEILALDIEYSKKYNNNKPCSSKVITCDNDTKSNNNKQRIFKSLPNLNSSNENLLV